MDRNAQEEIKAQLMRASPDYRVLADQHNEYKQQVAALEAKGFLSEQEEAEEQRLKKLKLRVKDQMEEMVSHYKAQHAVV